MGMRLLPQKEIDRAKSVEKKQEIDEGMKLAKRVDDLREIAASEEASLETFRRETVAKIHEEIKTETERRDKVKSEADEAEARRDEARKPLDSEWAKVIAERGVVDARGKALDERDRVLGEKELENDAAQKRIREIVRRALETDALSDSRLREAGRASEDATFRLKAARKIEFTTREVKERTEKELAHREELVTARENGATIKESDIAAREKTLADGWKLLRDQQAMLERNYARLNKKYG